MAVIAAPQAQTLSRRGSLWPLVGLIAWLCSACIVSGDKCDASEVHVADSQLDYCACAPGSIPDPKGHGCQPCGANAAAKDGKCVCNAGFVRPGPTGVCEMTVGGSIGVACTDGAICSDPYAYCATDGADHYCTKQGCAAADCPAGYTCETVSGATFCAKLPSGLGEPCMTDAECATFKASSCNTFAKQCVLTGCASGLRCPNTWGCCDVSAFVPGISFCFAPDAMCTGKVVMP